jgi:hypothetical protein
MQKVNYSVDIDDPTFSFGNSDLIISQIKAALVKEVTDIANSNFISSNASTDVQSLQTLLTMSDIDGFDYDVNNTSNVIASRNWVKMILKNLPYSTVGKIQFLNDILIATRIYTNISTTHPDSTVTANYVTMAELDCVRGLTSNAQSQIDSKANTTDLNTTNTNLTTANTNITTLTTNLATTNTNLLNATTFIKTGSNIAYTAGNTTVSNLIVNTAVTVPDASIGIAKITGLTTALDGKVNTAPIFTQPGYFTDMGFTGVLGLDANFNNFIDVNDLFKLKGVTSNIQTQLNSKMGSIAVGGIADNMLASTFAKPNTAVSFTSINCTSETDSGNITVGSISEKFTSIGNNGTANIYNLDYVTNTSVYVLNVAPTTNFTVRMYNCGTDVLKNMSFTIIYNTTGKWYCNTVQCYSDATTLITPISMIWNGGAAPVMVTSTVIIQTFTLVRNFATNYVLTNCANYA